MKIIDLNNFHGINRIQKQVTISAAMIHFHIPDTLTTGLTGKLFLLL